MAFKRPRCRISSKSDAATVRLPVRASHDHAKVKRQERCGATRAAPSDVFVFDMDGTLVDSEPEVRYFLIHRASVCADPLTRSSCERALGHFVSCAHSAVGGRICVVASLPA